MADVDIKYAVKIFTKYRKSVVLRNCITAIYCNSFLFRYNTFGLCSIVNNLFCTHFAFMHLLLKEIFKCCSSILFIICLCYDFLFGQCLPLGFVFVPIY